MKSRDTLPQGNGIKSRIVGQSEEQADKLKPHPLNWRTHSPRQGETMAGALEAIGWIQRVIVNRRTGHILDGHLRAEQAARNGERVPVVWVDIDEQEELLVLASIDPIGMLAGKDFEKLRDLINDVETENDALAQLLKEHAADPSTDGDYEMPDEDNYKEQNGLIVECHSRADQESTLKRLQAAGYNAKAITV